MAENTNTQNVNKEYSPIVFTPVPKQIEALGAKSPDQKLYLILWVDKQEENNGFALCEGPMDCYAEIARLLSTNPDIDIHGSVVLVEVPAVNKNNEGEWMLKHPSRALTIYGFCRTVQGLFGGIDFDIEEYNDDEHRLVENVDEESSAPIADTDGMVSEYKNIMSEREKENENG